MITEERLVFFDIETARLDKATSAIIQIAALAVNTGLHEIGSFETKIRFNPAQASPEALTMDSFEPTLWKRIARDPKDASFRFAEFLRKHATVDLVSRQGKPYQVAQLVSHNAAFDGPFLVQWYQDLGVFLPAARRVFCTLQRAFWFFHENRQLTPPANFKLGTLAEFFGVSLPEEEAHDALGDVRACLGIYRAMTVRTASVAKQAA